MKNRINLWIVMFLAISLALPIYTMAQTTKLTLESPSGDRIGCANVKTFSLGADNNLVVYLDGAFNCVALLPDILLSSSTNCTITGPASVTASPSANLSFNVQSSDTSAAISLVVDPEGRVLPSPATPGTPFTFSWNTGGSPAMPPGSYLAVFQATDGANTSQLVVMIKIAQQYKLTLTAGANGLVSPAGETYYDPGTQVQISATANSTYYFSGWSGGLTGTTNPTTILMDANKTVTASFTQTPPTTYTLTTSVSPAGGGTVSGAGTYNEGVTATVTVSTTTTGYTFSNWSGAASGTSTTTTVLMNGAKSVTANFTPPPTPPSSGALGTKTNPIKLSKPMVLVDKGYMSQTSLDSTMGAVNLPGNTKLYFEVDPLGTTGISARSFGLNTKFYNQAFSVCKSLYNKGTQTPSTEVCGFPSTYRDIVYDNIPDDLDNYKYLYGIDNNGTASFNIDVWVTINP